MYLFGSINERFIIFKKDYSNYVYNLNMIFSFEAYFVIKWNTILLSYFWSKGWAVRERGWFDLMFNFKKITTQNCFDTEGGVWFWYQSLCTMFTCTRLNFSLVIFSSKILYISCLCLPFGDIYCLIMKSHFPWVCL